MALKIVGENTLQALVQETEQRYVKQADVSEYSVTKKETADSGYASTYVLTKEGEAVGEPINIPKDYLVKSAGVKTAAEADVPVAGYQPGDKYIDFVINTVADDGNESHIYLLVQELVDAYAAGNGIDVGADNKISVKVNAGNANGLSVGADGLQMAVATETTAGAMSAEDKQKLGTALQADDLQEITAAEVSAMFAAEEG